MISLVFLICFLESLSLVKKVLSCLNFVSMAAAQYVVLLSLMSSAAAVDYACYTGSSSYERLTKVCNLQMSESNPEDIDGSINTWFCSVTKVVEMEMSNFRNAPWVW